MGFFPQPYEMKVTVYAPQAALMRWEEYCNENSGDNGRNLWDRL